MTEHTQQLIQQIILADSGLDEQLGSTLKAFYKLGRQDALVEQLGHVVQKKEQEIEKVCHAHYQDFVQSVDQLLGVRSDTQSLRAGLQAFHADYEGICNSFLAKKKDLAEYRKIYLNIEKATETVRSCLFLLELARKMNYLIDEKSYYSALKTLEELHNYHLRYMSKFDFVTFLQDCVPNIQQNVKLAVLNQLKECIRDWSRIVGELALAKTRKEESKDGVVGDIQASMRKLSRSHSILAGTRKNSKQSLQSLSWKSLEQALNEDDEVDLFNNDRIQVDFRPLYQCIHINDVLGTKHTLKTMYEENRRLQANLVLTTPFSLNENDISGFEKYLYDIIGFFIVEAYVASTTENFRRRANIDLLWETATDKLNEVVAISLRDCQNPEHFLKIKELMIVFIQTMENYNFSVAKLLNLLMTFFEQYSNLKMLIASKKCDESIEVDDGVCVNAHGITELQEILRVYSYKEKHDEKSPKLIFPKVFPFSKSFMDCCNEIKQFIFGFYQFAEGFHQQFNEMDDILKKAVETLVTQHICSSIENKLSTGNIKLSEVVRIIINLENYQAFVNEIESIIIAKRSSQRLKSPKSENRTAQNQQASATLTSNCQKTIQDTKKSAENKIFELVNRKIDDFLDLAEYDFFPVDPKSGSPVKPATRKVEPSPYLVDLVSFLDVVWSSTLADLPVTVKSFVYYDAIFHLVSRLLGMVSAPTVKKLSPVFIDQQFDTDIAFLESFVLKLGDPNLIDQLLEVRQTIELIKSETNLEEFLMVSTRNKKYSRVSKATALSLLEKIRDGGFWNDSSSLMTALGMSTANPKDVRAAKRKQLETTIKSLKDELVGPKKQ